LNVKILEITIPVGRDMNIAGIVEMANLNQRLEDKRYSKCKGFKS
jgi:serine kinase of HPr protein (carbohydrate metabolism regulator)